MKHVLDSLAFDGSRATDKSGAVVAIEMEPTEVQWLRVNTVCTVYIHVHVHVKLQYSL